MEPLWEGYILVTMEISTLFFGVCFILPDGQTGVGINIFR
jgi:hypothetical protein